MIELQPGGNGPVDSHRLTVAVSWSAPPGIDPDVSAFLLGESGRVGSDLDMVFYNQPAGGAGAVRLAAHPGRGIFTIDLAQLPPAVARIPFCLTVGNAPFSALQHAQVMVDVDGRDMRFVVPREGASEAAMILGELYRRQGQWKFRAIGQGFHGGLGPLARSYGIVVDDGPGAQAPPAPAFPPAGAPSSHASAYPPETAPSSHASAYPPAHPPGG
jgi:tellurite resistance protein TerA